MLQFPSSLRNVDETIRFGGFFYAQKQEEENEYDNASHDARSATNGDCNFRPIPRHGAMVVNRATQLPLCGPFFEKEKDDENDSAPFTPDPWPAAAGL